jgi:hypothetical protein
MVDSDTAKVEINSRNQIVLSLDPGGTTGIAWRLPGGVYVTQTCDTPDCLYEIMCHGKPDVVIVEDFETGGRVNQFSIYTIKLVGAALALAYSLGSEVYLHMPIERRAMLRKSRDFLTQSRGPGQGSGTRNPAWVVHEKDALAHLFTWEYRCLNEPNYSPIYNAAAPALVPVAPEIATKRQLKVGNGQGVRAS